MKIICKKHNGIFTIQCGERYRGVTTDFHMFAEMLEGVVKKHKQSLSRMRGTRKSIAGVTAPARIIA